MEKNCCKITCFLTPLYSGPAVAIVNQAVKVSLCRHKKEGAHGCKSMGDRLTLKS